MNAKPESALADVPLFAGLDAAELAILSRHVVTKQFPKSAVIINEGDQIDTLYVILAGRVKVYASDEEGREILLNLQGPGEHFGEMALLDDAPRSASVMTTEPTRLAIISKQDFRNCLAQAPDIAFNLIRHLVARVRRLTASVKNLGLHDVYGRLSRTLQELAIERDNKLVIEQRLTHQDIASMVGSSREMVSRILKDLARGGYITVEDRQITINKRLPAEW